MASKKISIGPGRYRRGDHLVAEVRIGSARDGSLDVQRKRFPLGTEERELIAWQYSTKGAMITARPAPVARGTLAADIPEYLTKLPLGKYRSESDWVLQHWIDSPLGGMTRAEITQLDIIGQISRWLDGGAAVATCNKRLSRLRKMFHADNEHGRNPTDGIKFSREPEQESRDIPQRIVKLILESLPDVGRAAKDEERPDVSLTKIRLRILAYSGIAPATQKRVRSQHLDLKHSRIYLRARRKGKGTPPSWIALLPDAVAAWRDFAAANLFGATYSNASIGKTWRVGIARATKRAAELARETGDDSWLSDIDNLPPRCKPYDLRHAFASEIYRITGDIRAVAELLQHSDLEMTKRYTKGAVSERVTAAIAKAAPSYAVLPTLPPMAGGRVHGLRLVRKA